MYYEYNARCVHFREFLAKSEWFFSGIPQPGKFAHHQYAKSPQCVVYRLLSCTVFKANAKDIAIIREAFRLATAKSPAPTFKI